MAEATHAGARHADAEIVRMDIGRPVGHERIVERLARLAEQPEALDENSRTGIPHAVAMAGPAGVGKFRTALWWAGRLKCDRPDPGDGSCECPSCLQIAVGAHPDVTLLERPDDKKVLGVDLARALIRTMGFRPTRPGPRIAIIPEGERLTSPAQSALLKLLEEPPGFAVIILVTTSATALFPTIRSRCQMLRFGPLVDEDVARLLAERGVEESLVRSATIIARGSVGTALSCSPEDVDDRADLIESFELFRAGDGEGPSLDEMVRNLFERHGADRAGLAELLEWQMRKVESALGCPPRAESDRLSTFLERATDGEADELLEAATRIRATMRLLDRNANRRLALRDLLLDMRPS